MERILCPFSEESTPSLVVYENGYHCYGCGKSGPLTDLGRKGQEAPKERYKEDLSAKRRYIETLPEKEVRGFRFRYDAMGFYLCWDNDLYYKLRLWNPTEKQPKYKNPSGHSQPMYVVRQLPAGTLFLVEGEINAMSVAQAFPENSVVSPGSASDFLHAKQEQYLTLYRKYANVVIVVDRDAAGTEAAIRMKALLQGKVPYVQIVLLEPDANEILCKQGRDELRRSISQKM